MAKQKHRVLLGVNGDYKTSKGQKLGYMTGIMYLAPSTIVDGLDLCPFASASCKAACLFTAGRGAFNSVKQARINKTTLYRDNPEFFFYSLVTDINKLITKAKNKGMKPCVRLNGTSDIRFEQWRDGQGRNIFEVFPHVQFYDYTKDFKRVEALTGKWSNYHVTFSYSGKNGIHAKKLLDMGVNVAVVFRNDLPTNFWDNEVINGDDTDLRFLDKRGVVVGLKAKGAAKRDKSGFVVDFNLDMELAA